jgi:zinc transport system permease protein
LGVLAHSALAFGLVAVSFLSGVRIDLMAYLFGDILAVSRGDLAVIWGGAALVVGLIAWRWSALADGDAERGSGLCQRHRPRREQLILTLALAITVAVAIKVVGVLADRGDADHPGGGGAPAGAHARGDGADRGGPSARFRR